MYFYILKKDYKMNNPTFTINSNIIDYVARIAEKVGQIYGSQAYHANLKLRKINRLRSIQSSLAIENNSLTLNQVTDIIDGKRVLGLPHEIQEVLKLNLFILLWMGMGELVVFGRL